MSNPAPAADSPETILRQCAAAAPEPWYPRDYAAAAGIDRDRLDPSLDALRLAGLIRLTDWVRGKGQGYALTPDGARLLNDPRGLARALDGRAPRPAAGPAPLPVHTAYERGEVIRDALLDPPYPLFTRLLLFLNVAVFLWGVYLSMQANVDYRLWLSGGQMVKVTPSQAYLKAMHDTGAVQPADLLAGPWWEWGRLLTNCFVHYGLLHLGLNMWGLYILGQLLEPMYGRWRFLAIYLLAGLGGSCTAMAWPSGPYGQLGGASGALCGLFTALIAWLLLNRRYLPPELLSRWMRNIGINIALLVGISLVPGVSATAHAGGAAVGLLAALALHWQRFGPPLARWLGVAAVPLLAVGCVGAVEYAMRANPKWQAMIESYEVADLEREQLPVVRDLENAAHRKVAGARVKALVGYRPQGRNPADVKRAVAALTEARAEIGQAVERMGQAGPYRSELAREAKQARLDELEARADLWAGWQRCLEAGGAWTPRDQKELEEKEKRLRGAEQHWRELTQPR